MDKETISKGVVQNTPCPIWNRALSAEELEWLYKNSNSKPAHEVGRFRENGKLVYYGPDGRKY